MRKILSLFAAMLMVLSANAKVWTVGPNHNEEADRADCNIYVTLDRLAQAGDTILLADGEYDEPYSAAIKNNVVMMPAKDAKPVVKTKGYYDVKASAKIIGVKFVFVGDAGNGYAFYVRENTPKFLELENCEFTAFTKYCITGSSSSAHIDSVFVNNCYFHDNALSPIYFPASSLADAVNLCDYLKVTNSTFANTTTLNGAGIIDNRNNGSSTASTSKLVVDHCTFYNCKGYERMIQSYKSPLAYVTNCIMMNPLAANEEPDIYATYLYGGEIHHNLNYQTKRQYGSGVTVTDSIQKDPQFVDAANANYTLAATSPALKAASDGSNLGDPRWAPAAPIGAPAYFLVGNMNNWKPDSAYMFTVNPANENEYMLNTTLAVGDSVKVLGIVGNTQTWYPDNAPNYGVDAAHAGKKTIYFQTTYKADWAEFGGYMWMEANPAPEPATLVYSYVHTKYSSNSSYAEAYNVTVNEMEWSIMANLATDAATRFGGKSLTAVDKPMYTKQPMAAAIDSIVIRHLGCTSDKLKVNSIKVEVASDAAFATLLDTITVTPTIGKNDTNTVKIALTNAVVNSYYRITYNLTNSQNSNYAFQITQIDFYGTATPEPPVEVVAPYCNTEVGHLFAENADPNSFVLLSIGAKDGKTIVRIDQDAAKNTQMFDYLQVTGLASAGEDVAEGGETAMAVEFDTPAAVNDSITLEILWSTVNWAGRWMVQNVKVPAAAECEYAVIPAGPVDYYMKNNWDAGSDWTWKKMTKDEANYKLENVVFGGTGVNYNTAESDEGATWVPVANFLGDKVDAKDTVTFVLNPADSTITATLLGKYIEPTPEPEGWSVIKFTKVVAKDSLAADASFILLGSKFKAQITDTDNKMEIDANACRFGSAEGYDMFTHRLKTGGKSSATKSFITLTIPEDGNLAIAVRTGSNSDTTRTLIVKQENDTLFNKLILESQAIEVMEDTTKVKVYPYASIPVKAGTVVLSYPVGSLNFYAFAFKKDTPEPQNVYTVAGSPATVFGAAWDENEMENDMVRQEDGTCKWVKTGLKLAAGKVEFKIVENHNWQPTSWPASNYELTIPEMGEYTITIIFNPETKEITANAEKTGDAIVLPVVQLHGTFTNPNWATTDAFAPAADSSYASLKLNLEAKTYEFGMKFDGAWKANGANITRENPSTSLKSGSNNMHMVADQAGEYTFKYFYAEDSLAVIYPKLIPHYDVAEAIAAGLQENDLVYVRGIVTKMEFKGTNFAKYGSVNIYVADATGAEGEFEFYNCYSLEADTFRISDPAYDATSTQWAQFNSVTDGNGKTVHVGDLVEAYGKYKLFNKTHELNTGCYLTVVEQPAPSLIYDVKLFNRDWTPDTISTVTWDGINEKVIVDIIPGKSDAWQGQVWLKLPMDVKKEKEYDLSFKIKASKTFGGSIVKYQENAEMLFDNQLALTANEELTYEVKNMPGVLAAGDVTGNGVLCMSFGYCPDSTLIEMYAISIVEHDPTTIPAKFYVTGNDAFTVDAGKTIADSWNIKAFKSEADTMTFALKAGAEYQIKVSVDGTWNTAMGYNDLSEVTPGIIDADGNNHNIGFSLVEDGEVMVIYTAGVPNNIFKVVGNFVTQGIENTNDNIKAIKRIENGMIIIEKNGKKYTITGQLVK